MSPLKTKHTLNILYNKSFEGKSVTYIIQYFSLDFFRCVFPLDLLEPAESDRKLLWSERGNMILCSLDLNLTHLNVFKVAVTCAVTSASWVWHVALCLKKWVVICALI